MSTTASIPLSPTITITTTLKKRIAPLNKALTAHHNNLLYLHLHQTTTDTTPPKKSINPLPPRQHTTTASTSKTITKKCSKITTKTTENHQRNFCWGLQRRKNLDSDESEEISNPLSPRTLMGIASTTEPLDFASPRAVDTIDGSVMPEEHRKPHSALRVGVVALTLPSSWVAAGVEW
ncbi:Hypothetical predicted protein [Olea europaea subsp. europaea]|uniref:Uncharacterized protein n=1 Tax=Olea europaea subsp. europaea TaxID=158383 RepID=A0A8S0SHE2_OLEEU|nr:Hypothetical predicted protein [Olea europaea subsp. europaea]